MVTKTWTHHLGYCTYVVLMSYPCSIGVLPIFQKLLMLFCCTHTSVHVGAS